MDLNRILQTLTVAQEVGATVEDRRAEVALFDELRNHGNVQSVLQIGAELTTNASLLVQAQLMGYAVLQYVAGNRWNELGAAKGSLCWLCFQVVGTVYDKLNSRCTAG
eukprot:jgi/Picre1/32009/NNA_007357.t1